MSWHPALVLEQHKTKVPRINLKHLFNAEKQKNGSWKGNHHLGLDKNCIVEFVSEVDEFGAFAAYFEKEGIRKYSDFFPTNWSRVKVIEKIKEAFFNPIKLSEYGLIGETSEGMRIQMYFKKISSTGEYIINTAYPKIR